MVETKERARLFTSISLVDTVGQLIRAPLMESLFATSIHFQGLARGLPFFISGVSTNTHEKLWSITESYKVCQLAASIALWSLNPKSTGPDEDEN